MRGRRKYEKMNIINVENITKSYTGRKLFSKASFYVQENEKIGIIGINGTGKSTLLKIVAGDEEPDEGTVTTANHIVIQEGRERGLRLQQSYLSRVMYSYWTSRPTT